MTNQVLSGTRALVHSIASNYLGFIAQSVVTLLLTPFLLSRLGATSFGIWVLLTSLVAYFQMLELGMMPAIIHHVAGHLARDERSEAEDFIGTASAILVAVAVVTVPLTVLAMHHAPTVVNLDGADPATLQRGILLVGVVVVCAFARRLLYALLEGCQRFGWLNVVTTTGLAVATTVAVVLIQRGHGVVSLVAVLAGQTMFEAVLLFVVQRHVVGLRIRPWRFRRIVAKRLFRYSSYAFVIELALGVSHRVDALVIGLFLPVAAITPFAIGSRIAAMLESITDPLIDTFFPLASSLEGRSDRTSLARLLVLGTRVSMMVAAPGAIVVALHGRTLVDWWVGPEHLADVLPILYVFIAVMCVSVCEATASRVLLGTGKVRFDALVSLASAVANLTISVLLVGPMGALGVAIGTLVPSTVGKLGVSIPYACALAGQRVGRFYIDALAPVVAFAASAILLIELLPIGDVAPGARLAIDALLVAAMWLAVAGYCARERIIRTLQSWVRSEARAASLDA